VTNGEKVAAAAGTLGAGSSLKDGAELEALKNPSQKACQATKG
jgi:hypothetical protein